MSMRNMRWEYVLLWAFLALMVLALAHYSYRVFRIERPLKKCLSENPDVLRADIESIEDTITIDVSLGYVDDLSLAYKKIEDSVQNIVGQRAYEVVIRDDSDETLEKAYDLIHFYVEEARLRGNFGDMANQSSLVLKNMGIEDFNLTVNDNNIYIQLRLKEKYLYRIKDLKDIKGGPEL